MQELVLPTTPIKWFNMILLFKFKIPELSEAATYSENPERILI
jgi:hypothetical protein